MKERPIIFSGEVVKAILDGRCTQTRRVIKDPRRKPIPIGTVSIGDIQRELEMDLKPNFPCPYGQVGNRLWVRETWGVGLGHIIYKEGVNRRGDESNLRLIKEIDKKYPNQWRPSIFMPRWASRILLEITEVRVERIQDIVKNSNEHDKNSDIYAEGVEYMPPYSAGIFGYNIYTTFRIFWDSLNAKRGYGWEVNPWVWVIKFKILET